jgi:predicted transcriptional regulator
MNARTLIIDALIERVASWPEAAQEEAVNSLLAIEARHVGTYPTSPEERAAILRGLAEADRDEFVSDEEMAAFFKRHGL